jgi:hypothetical protein
VNPIVNNFTPIRLLANYISKFHYSGYVMQISVNYFAGLRRRSAASRLLKLWVRFLPGHGRLSFVSDMCFQVEVSVTG